MDILSIYLSICTFNDRQYFLEYYSSHSSNYFYFVLEQEQYVSTFYLTIYEQIF